MQMDSQMTPVTFAGKATSRPCVLESAKVWLFDALSIEQYYILVRSAACEEVRRPNSVYITVREPLGLCNAL